jgi:hypothetical protein
VLLWYAPVRVEWNESILGMDSNYYSTLEPGRSSSPARTRATVTGLQWVDPLKLKVASTSNLSRTKMHRELCSDGFFQEATAPA